MTWNDLIETIKETLTNEEMETEARLLIWDGEFGYSAWAADLLRADKDITDGIRTTEETTVLIRQGEPYLA